MVKIKLEVSDILIQDESSKKLIESIAEQVVLKMNQSSGQRRQIEKKIYYLTVKEASEMAKVSKSKIRNLIHKGDLEAEKVDEGLTKSKFLINYESFKQYFNLM
ncbi:excisionase family DNA-binding protein [Flammeovirga sp. OC4]|uniref:excisionase family DNA-binding protein n=1 Tax=Flammeovirga sp. OC4 TaxID=1382345 RepID=UPI0005C4370F|nr:helix-turn-helix domain-containing protein [Flammeovirga sp. OC4]